MNENADKDYSNVPIAKPDIINDQVIPATLYFIILKLLYNPAILISHQYTISYSHCSTLYHMDPPLTSGMSSGGGVGGAAVSRSGFSEISGLCLGGDGASNVTSLSAGLTYLPVRTRHESGALETSCSICVGGNLTKKCYR